MSPEDFSKVNVKVVPEIKAGVQAIVSVGQSVVLGDVFFDLDKDIVKPEFYPLLQSIAQRMAEAHGGVISVMGHTDKRASDQYNQALSERRAKAVNQLLKQFIEEAMRQKVKVQYQGEVVPNVSSIQLGGVK